MGFYIQRDKRIGTDNELFIKDLKTVRGVQNRILRGKYFQSGVYDIYSYNDNSVFDESQYKLICSFTKTR